MREHVVELDRGGFLGLRVPCERAGPVSLQRGAVQFQDRRVALDVVESRPGSVVGAGIGQPVQRQLAGARRGDPVPEPAVSNTRPAGSVLQPRNGGTAGGIERHRRWRRPCRRGVAVDDVDAFVRPGDLDNHAWERAELGERAGDCVSTAHSGACGDVVLVHHLDADDHPGSPASGELAGPDGNGDQVAVELVRLGICRLVDRGGSPEVDPRGARRRGADLGNRVPPLRSRVAGHALTRPVDVVAGVIAERNDRGVADHDVAGVDLVVADPDRQQHLDPLRPLAGETPALRDDVVGVDLVPAKRLPDDVAVADLVRLGPRALQRVALARVLGARHLDPRHEQPKQRLGALDRGDRDRDRIDALRLFPDVDLIVGSDLGHAPAAEVDEPTVDRDGHRIQLTPADATPITAIARHVPTQPGVDWHPRADGVLAQRLRIQLVREEFDHGRRSPG